MSNGPPGAALTNKKAKQISANNVGIAPRNRETTNFKVFIFVVVFLSLGF
jgi:hypothetical protein